FVHQVGMNNYAGPAASCPGIGWNCTTALRVVQLAFPGGQNSMECDGDDHMSKKRECVGVQSKGSTNTFTCRETSNETAATETCGPYTQSGDTNHAHIKQVVTQQSNVADTTQTAAESADLTQNGTVRNDVDVLQLVRQTIGTTAEHDPSTQVANNSAAIRQNITGWGTNLSKIHQGEDQNVSGTGTGSQFQNMDSLLPDCAPETITPTLPNACAEVLQTTDNGTNNSRLLQLINERGTTNGIATQQQGM